MVECVGAAEGLGVWRSGFGDAGVGEGGMPSGGFGSREGGAHRCGVACVMETGLVVGMKIDVAGFGLSL